MKIACKLLFSLMLAVFAITPSLAIENNNFEAQKKMLDQLNQLDQLDQLDKLEFFEHIDKANACIRSRNYICAESKIAAAGKFADSKDKQTLMLTKKSLADERLTEIREQEELKRLALLKRQQEEARRMAESNNEDRNLIGTLFGVATGVAMKNVGGASSGDAFQAGMAMFNDVSNNTTSNMQNLNQSKNNSSSQLGGSLYQNKNGLSQQGSDNAFDPQGCGIEATKCGPDSACRDRVYQSPMCNNGSSPYTYDDFLNNTVKKDLRIKANPNIK